MVEVVVVVVKVVVLLMLRAGRQAVSIHNEIIASLNLTRTTSDSHATNERTNERSLPPSIPSLCPVRERMNDNTR